MQLDAVTHAGDPQVGNLATALNSSSLSTAFIQNLPAYRKGLSPNRRGLEVGMAHGYFLYGPLALLGPLRATDVAPTAGILATIGFVMILTVALSLYAAVTDAKPTATLTTPEPPAFTREDWSEFAGGFLLGGCGGAFFAYFLCQTPHLAPLQNLASGVWSS